MGLLIQIKSKLAPQRYVGKQGNSRWERAMAKTLAIGVLRLTLSMVVAARAQESDLAAGEKLHISQCKICHGSLTPEAALPGPY